MHRLLVAYSWSAGADFCRLPFGLIHRDQSGRRSAALCDNWSPITRDKTRTETLFLKAAKKGAMMTDKDPKGKNTSGGGHLGGTNFGQSADAKTASTVEKKGDEARPNDGKK
jgi:hypothetical protein